MDLPPPISGNSDAYEFHIEFCLQWLCERCGHHQNAADDIRDREDDAPLGPWRERHAREAMEAGWYVRPLAPDGGLTSTVVYCPACAGALGLKIATPPADPTVRSTRVSRAVPADGY